MKSAYLMLLGSTLLLSTGCATHYLWTKTEDGSFCEPVPNPQLRLYVDSKGKDVLATYDEMNDHNDRVVRRAYFVFANSRRISHTRQPMFVEPETATRLHPVPLRVSTNNLANYVPEADGKSSGWFAVMSQQRFGLFHNDQPRGIYDLPVYDDGTATAKRLFLTPWTLALDVTIIGGFLYLKAGAPGLVE